jgi:hypothetical protein
LIGFAAPVKIIHLMQRMQVNPVLDYGVTTRVNVRRVVHWLAATLGILCLGVPSIGIAWNSLAHYQENRVTAELKSIPGATVLKVYAYEDKPTCAEVNLDSSPNRSIWFHAPRGGELSSGSRMSVGGLGSNHVLVYFRDENWSQGGLDFGRNNPLAAVLPFRFRDVRDLAAHYDEVEAFVRQEPRGTFTDQRGVVCKYRIEVRPR